MAKPQRISRSEQAGLVFPVGRTERYLRKLVKERITAGAAVYLAGVLEFLLRDLLDCVGYVANRYDRARINPRFIMLAIEADDEFKALLPNVMFSSAGRPVSTHAALEPTCSRLRLSKERRQKLEEADIRKFKARTRAKASDDSATDEYPPTSDVDEERYFPRSYKMSSPRPWPLPKKVYSRRRNPNLHDTRRKSPFSDSDVPPSPPPSPFPKGKWRRGSSIHQDKLPPRLQHTKKRQPPSPPAGTDNDDDSDSDGDDRQARPLERTVQFKVIGSNRRRKKTRSTSPSPSPSSHNHTPPETSRSRKSWSPPDSIPLSSALRGPVKAPVPSLPYEPLSPVRNNSPGLDFDLDVDTTGSENETSDDAKHRKTATSFEVANLIEKERSESPPLELYDLPDTENYRSTRNDPPIPSADKAPSDDSADEQSVAADNALHTAPELLPDELSDGYGRSKAGLAVFAPSTSQARPPEPLATRSPARWQTSKKQQLQDAYRRNTIRHSLGDGETLTRHMSPPSASSTQTLRHPLVGRELPRRCSTLPLPDADLSQTTQSSLGLDGDLEMMNSTGPTGSQISGVASQESNIPRYHAGKTVSQGEAPLNQTFWMELDEDSESSAGTNGDDEREADETVSESLIRRRAGFSVFNAASSGSRAAAGPVTAVEEHKFAGRTRLESENNNGCLLSAQAPTAPASTASSAASETTQLAPSSSQTAASCVTSIKPPSTLPTSSNSRQSGTGRASIAINDMNVSDLQTWSQDDYNGMSSSHRQSSAHSRSSGRRPPSSPRSHRSYQSTKQTQRDTIEISSGEDTGFDSDVVFVKEEYQTSMIADSSGTSQLQKM